MPLGSQALCCLRFSHLAPQRTSRSETVGLRNPVLWSCTGESDQVFGERSHVTAGFFSIVPAHNDLLDVHDLLRDMVTGVPIFHDTLCVLILSFEITWAILILEIDLLMLLLSYTSQVALANARAWYLARSEMWSISFYLDLKKSISFYLKKILPLLDKCLYLWRHIFC